MAFDVSSFRKALNGGARANLFKVSITGVGDAVTLNPVLELLCKSASLPASSIGLVEVPFNAGRRYKMGGERTYADWTTTIINDENFTLRTALENWQNDISNTDFESTSVGNRNASDNGTGQGLLATPSVYVRQLDDAGKDVKVYKLHDCWPSDISTIDLSYDTTDSVEEFTVTWTYDYFTEVTSVA